MAVARASLAWQLLSARIFNLDYVQRMSPPPSGDQLRVEGSPPSELVCLLHLAPLRPKLTRRQQQIQGLHPCASRDGGWMLGLGSQKGVTVRGGASLPL